MRAARRRPTADFSRVVAAAATAAVLAFVATRSHAAPVKVRGATACPSAEDVTLSLSRLYAAAGPEPDSRNVATLDESESGVRLRLQDDQGRPLAERVLPSTPSCAALAEAAAVALMAWEASAAPVALPALDLTARDPVPAREHASVDLGAAATISSTSAANDAVAGAQVHAAAHRPGGLGVLVVGAIAAAHEASLGSSKARWRRWWIGAGPAYVGRFGRWQLLASSGLAVQWLRADGVGFPDDRSAQRTSPGAFAVVRAALVSSRLAPWVAVGATSAFANQRFVVEGTDASASVPRGDAFVALGVSVKLF